jgi:vancomycin resistance protein YoaR
MPLSLKNPKDRVRSRDAPEVKDVFDTPPGSRRPKDRRRRLIVPVLIACAVVAVLAAADYWMHYGRIYPGVKVGNVSLGDKTPEEARATLEERTTGVLKELRFSGDPGEFSLSPDSLKVDFDAPATVERAYAVGRQGGILKRIGERLGASWSTVSIPAAVDYDRGVARAEIKNLAVRVNQEPQDAYVSIRGPKVDVIESREGYAVDTGATEANLDRALGNMSGEVAIVAGALEPEVLTPAAEEAAEKAREAISDPVVLTYEDDDWKLSPTEIGQTLSFTPEGGELQLGLDRERLRDALSKVYNDIEVKPVEAGFEFRDGGIAVTQSKTGKEIEEEKLFGAIEAGLFEGVREYEVPVATTEPKLATDEAEKLKPTELIGSYRTNYTLSTDKSPERAENLRIASDAISGQFLAPGEVFSVNEVVSPLKYNETHVIIEGTEQKADGGGLCQVASTLYNAANYADLDIVERHPHDAQLPYIRPGLDATVWFGSLDMKFKNTTDGYIFLREYVADDGYIYAEIYGRPTGKKVEMDSEPEYLGSDYSEWITYQKITDENGKVTFDDVIHKDTYKPLIDEHGKVIPPNYEYLNIAPVIY